MVDPKIGRDWRSRAYGTHGAIEKGVGGKEGIVEEPLRVSLRDSSLTVVGRAGRATCWKA